MKSPFSDSVYLFKNDGLVKMRRLTIIIVQREPVFVLLWRKVVWLLYYII